MGKVGNKELAHVLIETYGLTRSAAEQFVSEMFQVLMAGLRDDKQVKIKARGTFKVTSVAARRSIDINTGDPIVIEGRDKISFVPDVSLRDEVNRPFSQFETVVLNDEVDFTEIDRKFAEDSDAFVSEVLQTNDVTLPEDEAAEELRAVETSAFKPEKPVEEAVADIIETSSEPVASVEQMEEAKAVEPVMSQEVAGVPIAEPVTEEEKKEEPTPESQPVQLEEAASKEDAEPLPSSIETSQMDEDTPTVEDEEPENSTLAAAVRRQRGVVRVLIAVAVVLLLAFVSGIYYFLGELQQRDNRIEHLEAQMVQTAKPHAARHAVTPESADPMAAKMEHLKASVNKAQNGLKQSQEAAARKLAAQEQKPQPESVKQKAPVHKTTAPEVKPRAAAADKDYNRDARVRTGAYRIVGVDKTLTVRQGQTLASISRAYLGAGMECYVEAVNGGRTEFKAGDKLNIPKLELKKKRHKKR